MKKSATSGLLSIHGLSKTGLWGLFTMLIAFVSINRHCIRSYLPWRLPPFRGMLFVCSQCFFRHWRLVINMLETCWKFIRQIHDRHLLEKDRVLLQTQGHISYEVCWQKAPLSPNFTLRKEKCCPFWNLKYYLMRWYVYVGCNMAFKGWTRRDIKYFRARSAAVGYWLTDIKQIMLNHRCR